MKRARQSFIVVIALWIAAVPTAAGEELPSYLKDRGPGIATSMFGTYVRPREFLIYPFFEYYHDHNLEYKPSDLGYSSEED